MKTSLVLLAILSVAATILAVAVIGAGLFATESYKAFADTNNQSSEFQGENKINNQTIDSTFCLGSPSCMS
jgi:hypothetical protein